MKENDLMTRVFVQRGFKKPSPDRTAIIHSGNIESWADEYSSEILVGAYRYFDGQKFGEIQKLPENASEDDILLAEASTTLAVRYKLTIELAVRR